MTKSMRFFLPRNFSPHMDPRLDKLSTGFSNFAPWVMSDQYNKKKLVMAILH